MQYYMMYFNPLTPRISFSNSPYCHTTLIVSQENLVLDQLIFSFHLITCLLDVVLILQEEILPRSFMGVKGLILTVVLVFRGRNIVRASSQNMVVMIDIDGKRFWRFSP